MSSLLITAFGPFGEFETNPSEVLAKSQSLCEYRVLPVTYAAADDFAVPEKFSKVLMLGACPPRENLRLEIFAHNKVGSRPDVSGVAKEPGPIADGPERLCGKLFEKLPRESEDYLISKSAGDYLCNYLYYLVTLRNPKLLTGFLHVPSFESVCFDRQLSSLLNIIKRVQ